MTSKPEPFDETAKAFYHHLFKNWGIQVETEREVFSHARKIDLVVTCTEGAFPFSRWLIEYNELTK